MTKDKGHRANQKNKSKGRSSAKQESFKQKLRLRCDADKCSICNEDCDNAVLEGGHFVSLDNRDRLKEKYLSQPEGHRQDIPLSPNDGENGLLLCPTCHKLFDKPLLHVKPDGYVVYFGDNRALKTKFNKTRVWWHDKIGQDHYPTADFMQWVFDNPELQTTKRRSGSVSPKAKRKDNPVKESSVKKSSVKRSSAKGKGKEATDTPTSKDKSKRKAEESEGSDAEEEHDDDAADADDE